MIIISLFSLPVLSHELVWKKSDHKIIEQKLSKNPIYKTQRLRRNQRIERIQLGSAISPYFKKGKTSYRFFEKISTCYKLTINETLSFYSKARCPNNFDDIYIKIGDVLAKRFIPASTLPSKVKLSKQFDIYNFLAHKNSFREIENIEDLDKYPTQIIDVSTNETFSILNNKGNVSIVKTVEVNRTALGYLSAEKKLISQTLKFDFYSERDFIFKDQSGSIYFYKRYQPEPFTFGFLNISNQFKNHLENLESLFYSFNGSSRCFRSDLIENSKWDCDTLLFKTSSLAKYRNMSLLKFDYENNNYKIIE
jgi:hypothetical protein